MAKRGIDISTHQGDIDLNALKSQIDFVIIRVGYGTKGTIDDRFKRNANLCKELNIPMGFYWYSYALDVEGAEKEADHFLTAIKDYTPTYGCWFDMEDADGYKKRNGMPNNDTLKNMCYAFCEKVEQAGYYAGIYASQSWFDNQLAGDRLNRFDKWVAQWPMSKGKQKGLATDPNSRSDVSLWQFTSKGNFNGIELDTNYAYKSFPNPSKPSVVPVQKDTHSQKFNIGDQVMINGNLYTSSTATTPVSTVNSKITTITRYATNAPHPYNTTGDLGWMDEKDIHKISITNGSRVRFTGTRSYSGIPLASWVHNDIFNVIEISGDRVVIGKGTAVTSAVNIKDCQLI